MVVGVKQRGRTLGLVLSGGGARGAFQVGVYERLRAHGRFGRPAIISGTSAGAINAALIAAGRSPEQMLRFWEDMAADPPVVASPEFFRDATDALVRLSLEELGRWVTSLDPARAFLQRLRNHLRPQRGRLPALIVEYLLTSRFELVSRFLESVSTPHVADTARLRERLVGELGGERIAARGVRLAINTVDAHNGRVVRWVTSPAPLVRGPDYQVVEAITVDMVLASAAIPLLFPAVRIGGRLLWDGGLLVNTPLAPVVALGADEIVTVLVTEPPDEGALEFENFGRAVERSVDSFLENAFNVDRKLLLERNTVARLQGGSYRDVTLYEALRPSRGSCFSTGSYLYFERAVIDGMYEAGRRAAQQWLDAGPRTDRLEEASEPAAVPLG